MLDAQTAVKLTGFIGRAVGADAAEMKQLRAMFVNTVTEMGPRNFVETMAAVLSDVLKSPGCDDVKLPLKKIFNVSLQELSENLERKHFHLPAEHPVALLNRDHSASVLQLRELDALFASMRPSDVRREMVAVKDRFDAYYAELDRHIRKEEEVLFPELSAAGMNEHPGVLKEEHKNFHRWCTDIKNVVTHELWDSAAQVVEAWRNGFVPAICNHIFRETNIFYPAALEFITEKSEWEAIAGRFGRISGVEDER